jgi:hypothetical protein
MSTSSLLEPNDIVWELVKKTFSAQQNIIAYQAETNVRSFDMPDRERFSNVVVFKERIEWLRLNKLLVLFSYCYFVLNI